MKTCVATTHLETNLGDEDRLDPTELRLRDLEDALELDLERRLAGLELRLRAEPAGDEARLLMLLSRIVTQQHPQTSSSTTQTTK